MKQLHDANRACLSQARRIVRHAMHILDDGLPPEWWPAWSDKLVVAWPAAFSMPLFIAGIGLVRDPERALRAL